MKLRRKSALIEQDVSPFVNVGGSAVGGFGRGFTAKPIRVILKEEERIIIN